MKYFPPVAAGLLGFAFVAIGLMFLLHIGPPPPELPPGSPEAMFMGAFGPTGYMTFVKVLEVLGGVLVAIPATRNFGLLILGPIIVNILAFNIFVLKGTQLWKPPIVPIIVVLALYLLWCGRREFAGLARSDRPVTV